MIKWKLMLSTLPLVFLILAFTYVRSEIWQIASLFEFADTAPMITAAALVIGFMMAGIMSDYKEGERLPADITR